MKKEILLLEVTHDIHSCFHRICIYWIVAFAMQTINLDDTTVKFEMWNVAGLENILLFE